MYSSTMAEQNEKPGLAIPRSYDLKLKHDYSAGIFSGAVKISISVVSETKSVVLGAVRLSVNPKSVSFASGNKVLEAARVDLLVKEKMVILEFKEKLPVGYGSLSMEFEGTLNPMVKGILRSIFKHNNGEKKNMAETTFMPANARCCFPCWYDPKCKATLKITSEAVASKPEGQIGGSHTLLIAAGIIACAAFRGILRPPGGYWQEHFSDHPERLGHALMEYTHPEAFNQNRLLSTVAVNAALGVLIMEQLNGWVRTWVRYQMVLLWTTFSSLMVTVLVFALDMKPVASALVWVCLVFLGVYAMEKDGYVEKVRVEEEEEEEEGEGEGVGVA